MEVKFLTRKNIENVIQDAKNLEKIVLPSQIKTIGAGTFSNYKNLKEINLNNGLIEIGQRAFANSNIETIIVPPSVVRISSSAFSECENLEKVTFLGELKKVSDGMFDGCKNLKVIDFPFETESIGMYSFRGCKSLKFLNLPNSIKEIGSYAFRDSGIEGLSCSYDTIIRPMAFIGTNIYYIYNTKDKLIFSKNLINYMDTAKCLDFSKLKYLKDFDIINPYLHQNNQKINDFIEQINKEKIIFPFSLMIDEYEHKQNFDNFETFKWYKMLAKNFNFFEMTTEQLLGFCLFGKAIGLFSKPINENRISKNGNKISQVVDYGQKSYEFLKLCFENKTLKFSWFDKIFNGINSEFNPKLAKFFMNENNFISLLNQDALSNGFIKRVCNEFNEVQKYHTSNNAQARHLAPTVDKFIEYFKINRFEGVDEDTLYIAKEIGKHFSEQKDFEIARDIIKMAKKNNIPHGLLKHNQKECFAYYNIRKCIPSVMKNKEEMNRLSELSNKKYRFQWIDKYDARNFTLGKYCSCCSHIKGAGFGIMSAGIISPDVQNLVFIDEDGMIVGKSTLYINREEGYGVFNNVEINNDIPILELRPIYKKYKEAIERFAVQYNKENPDKPLKKINVGFSHNDLNFYIMNSDKKEKDDNLLIAPDYSQFSFPGYGHYSGDSSFAQFIMWSKEDEEDREGEDV